MTTLPILLGPQDPANQLVRQNNLVNSLTQLLLSGSAIFTAPLAADLVYIKAAAIPANGAIAIAHQPDFPRKLQIRIVIGTTTTTAITAGTLTLVGIDPSGVARTEVISLIANASVTLQSTYAYATLTSGTVAAYAAAGSGTGNTLGIGQSAYLGLPLSSGFGNLTVNKEQVDQADEAVGAVDYVSGSVSPTTAPNGTHNFGFWFNFSPYTAAPPA